MGGWKVAAAGPCRERATGRDGVRVLRRAQHVDAIEAGERPQRVSTGGRPAVGEHDREPFRGRFPSQLARGRAQREREIGAPLPAQGEQVVDQRGGRPGSLWPWSTSASAANAITLVLARSVRARTTAAVAIAASPTAWPRIEPLWSTSRHSARRGAVQRRAIS